ASPMDRAEARDLLERMMEKLPEQDRELLFLKEVEGFSVQELAEILELNVNTVKVRLFRARARLMDVYRRRLKDNPGQPSEDKKGKDQRP
ncbi:MAG: sigma-70 region 4 domain-containing protein, partial [Candidatus Acidiferrales bacterium]